MTTFSKEVLGSVIAALGTIMSAIGATPSNIITINFRYNLELWGNVLQATGAALQADSKGEISLYTIGNEVQAIGNVTVVAGLVIDYENEIEKKIFITGNWIQALGGLVSFAGDVEDDAHSDQSLSAIGNLLHSIGNSLQAVGETYALAESQSEDKERVNRTDSESMIISGSWIQAIGSVISVIALTKV